MTVRSATVVVLVLLCIGAAGVAARRQYSQARVAQPAPKPLQVPWAQGSAPALNKEEYTSVDELRRIAGDKDRAPEQRVQAMFYLAQQSDWGSMDTLLVQLDDASPLVRGRAAAAIKHILGTDFQFRADDNRSKRLVAIDGIRRYWESRRGNPPTLR